MFGENLLDSYVMRGVFQAQPDKLRRDEALAWTMRWFAGHAMRLSVRRVDAGHSITVEPLLPPLPATDPVYRDLRSWLSVQKSQAIPMHRRLGPDIDVKLSNRKGMVSLALTSALPLDALTDRAVQLVNGVYKDFLYQPGRLTWVAGAFQIDPDSMVFF
ncbi:MAG: hypothetical protein ACK5LJ_16330 [Paracoccus sp. (in: a-proteobacteria)]